MQCAICKASGPFSLEACVIDESRPICDQCASALDSIVATDTEYSEQKKSYLWLNSKINSIRDQAVSSYVLDLLEQAKTLPSIRQLDEEIQIRKRLEREAAEARHDGEVAAFNPLYEYAVETVRDHNDGSADTASIRMILSRYASRGWRLHKTMVNEIGRTSSSSSVAGYTNGTNATIEETILIFERCVKPIER